jgi:phosphatidylinositol alpha-mannosyltransferase
MASRRLVDRLGIGSAVEFCGRVPLQEIPRAYASADVYCSPALGGETLGVVLLEAMACGTPVVASDIPGYDETVRSGTDGLLCPPGDPRALAQTLLQVLRNPDLSRRLAAAGPERARDYSWPLIASRTLDYYRELRDAGRPGASA